MIKSKWTVLNQNISLRSPSPSVSEWNRRQDNDNDDDENTRINDLVIFFKVLAALKCICGL